MRRTIPLTPVQHWFFRHNLSYAHHFNQSVQLLFEQPLAVQVVDAILSRLYQHHEALRTVFCLEEDGIVQLVTTQEYPGTTGYTISNREEATAIINELHSSLDLFNGPLLKACLFRLPDGKSLLVLIIHHLVVDGISWRILLEDFHALLYDNEAMLPRATDTFGDWAHSLVEYSRQDKHLASRSYWQTMLPARCDNIKKDKEGGNKEGNAGELSSELNETDTALLLTTAHHAYNTRTNELLLGALMLALHEIFNVQKIRVDVEGHGREDIGSGLNIGRTIGWFTNICPVILPTGKKEDVAFVLKQAKEAMREVQPYAIDFGVYRYMAGKNGPGTVPDAQIVFNYLGQLDSDITGKAFTVVTDNNSGHCSPERNRDFELEVNAMVIRGRMQVRIRYGMEQYSDTTIKALIAAYQSSLRWVITHCNSIKVPVKTPSDFSSCSLTVKGLEILQSSISCIDIAGLSPLQEMVYQHCLMHMPHDMYSGHITYRYAGRFEAPIVQQCLQQLVTNYEMLRTCFLLEEGKLIQVVLPEGKIPFEYKDSRHHGEEKEPMLFDYKQSIRFTLTNLQQGRLLKLLVVRMENNDYRFVWYYHSIILDVPGINTIIETFMQMYRHYLQGTVCELQAVTGFPACLKSFDKRDMMATSIYRPFVARKTAELQLDRPTTGSIDRLCKKWGISPSVFFGCLWGLLNADETGGIIGSLQPDATEPAAPGQYKNIFPCNTQYAEETSVYELCRRIQEDILNDLPDKHTATHLFHAILMYHSITPADITDWSPEDLEPAGISCDLLLNVIEYPSRYTNMHLVYNGNVFSEAGITDKLSALKQLIGLLIVDPDTTAAKLLMTIPENRNERIMPVLPAYCSPQNETESRLVNALASILALPKEQIGTRTDLSFLGLHIRRAIQLSDFLQTCLGLHMGPEQIYQLATIEKMTQRISLAGVVQTADVTANRNKYIII